MTKRPREGQSSSKKRQKPSTCFFEKQVVASVSLLPSDLHQTKDKGVARLLGMQLLRFSDELGGVLLAYNKLELLDHGNAFILDDSPYLHFNISYTAVTFDPAVGSNLEGKITKTYASHIALNVLHYFHASITADVLKNAGFHYDATLEQWQDKEETLGEGAVLSFVVSKVFEADGIMSLSGANPLCRTTSTPVLTL